MALGKIKKQKWVKPELKILVKSLPEEHVLGCCRASAGACQNEHVTASINCS